MFYSILITNSALLNSAWASSIISWSYAPVRLWLFYLLDFYLKLRSRSCSVFFPCGGKMVLNLPSISAVLLLSESWISECCWTGADGFQLEQKCHEKAIRGFICCMLSSRPSQRRDVCWKERGFCEEQQEQFRMAYLPLGAKMNIA